jgi:cell division control protein 7
MVCLYPSNCLYPSILIRVTGKSFASNIPEISGRTPWSIFAKKLNPSLMEPPPEVDPSEWAATKSLLKSALDLLEKCLEPMSVKRITARDALYHPFLAPDKDEKAKYLQETGEELKGDDEYFPHPAGEGVCHQHHDQDEDGNWRVFVGLAEDGNFQYQMIEAGEGQAIGSQPCEFHKDFIYY